MDEAWKYITEKRSELDALAVRALDENANNQYERLSETVGKMRKALDEMQFCEEEGRPPEDEIEVNQWHRRKILKLMGN